MAQSLHPTYRKSFDAAKNEENGREKGFELPTHGSRTGLSIFCKKDGVEGVWIEL